MQKLLFICNDFIGNTMSGPGIRYWEMAHALERKGQRVAILSRHIEKGFKGDSTVSVNKTSLLNLIRWIWRSDHIIQTGRPLSIFISILFGKQSIYDQYDPVIFELLELRPIGWAGKLRLRILLLLWKIRQRLILRFGQRFLVANEKQKDLLIGQMTILGHVDKLTSVAILPFGLPKTKPYKKHTILRGTKIKETDFLLVWGGGVWDWFDPFTLLDSLSKLAGRRDDIKVYFPGINPPSPDSRRLAVKDTFLAKARRLGLLDTAVFVNSGWTDYSERADYLLEADAGISLHLDSMETRFAFRTRILDYLWADLPVISSSGDSWAELIESRGLGITVPCEDIGALTAAIERMADDRALRERCRNQAAIVARDFEWDALVARLLDSEQ